MQAEEVDILEFQIPVESNKTLFVWDIQPGYTEEHIYEELFAVFSSFGPLYLLKVCPNAPLQQPGFYALVKFYSAAQALKAQRQTDAHTLFQNIPLKVRLSSKNAPHFLSSRPLSHARCVELANHYLGFNGWTSDIITLKELSDDEEEDEEGAASQRMKRLRFGCVLQLSFPQHGQSTRGVAVVEDRCSVADPEVLLQRRGRLQRSVREKALVRAFSTVLLVLIGDSKVMVELKHTDQVVPDQTEGVLQVNEFSWSDMPNEEDDDEEWDLTVS